MRTKVRTDERLAAGRRRIEVRTHYAEARPAGPLDYYDRVPFPFEGTIDTVTVTYLE